MSLLLNAMEHVLPHRLSAAPLFELPAVAGVGPFPVYLTNQMLMAVVAGVLVVLVLPVVARRQVAAVEGHCAPTGFVNVVEALVVFMRDQVFLPVLGHRTARFAPFLLSTFFFILACNLLGMMPIAEIIELSTGKGHLGGTATGAIYVTAGLALTAFLMIHVSGIKEQFLQHWLGSAEFERRFGGNGQGHGNEHESASSPHHEPRATSHEAAGHGHHEVSAKDPLSAFVAGFVLYWWNFAPHVFKPEPGCGGVKRLLLIVADLGMWVILLALELIGALVKPFALAIRLFANMIAGHIVLASILALVFTFQSWAITPAPVLGAVALSFLELFVAFLQAYIFTYLTTMFIGAAVAPEH